MSEDTTEDESAFTRARVENHHPSSKPSDDTSSYSIYYQINSSTSSVYPSAFLDYSFTSSSKQSDTT